MLNYAAGKDDPDLARHIESCPACQEELRTVRLLPSVRKTTRGSLPDLPDGLSATLGSLLPRIRPDLVPRESTSIVERSRNRAAMFIAELVFNSGLTPDLAGLRSTTSHTRQMAFVSDLADLDLELSPISNDWSVTGQLGMDVVPAGLVIRFVPASAAFLDEEHDGIITANISADGYFDLVLPSGDWVAAVTMEDATIVFRDIAI
jgi:hypothetical protein